MFGRTFATYASADKKQIRRIVLEEAHHMRADIVAGAVFPIMS